MRSGAIEALDAASTRRLFGREGELLAPLAEAFLHRYGEPLYALRLEGDPLPSIRFPPVVSEQEIFLYAPPSFRLGPHLGTYLNALGFAIDTRRRVSTVPLPSSFARRRALLEAGAEEGLRPALVPLRATLFTARGWLRHIAAGVLPINLHGGISRALAALGRPLALPLALPRPLREKMNNHFHALGHDMSLHALALHRIPAAPMGELRRLARAALRRGGRAPSRAARFFEESLTRSCVGVWAECDRPEAFSPLFMRIYPALKRELEGELRRHG